MKGHSALIQGLKWQVFLFDIRVRISSGSKEMMFETDLKESMNGRQKLGVRRKNLGKENSSHLGLNISQNMLFLPKRLYFFPLSQNSSRIIL